MDWKSFAAGTLLGLTACAVVLNAHPKTNVPEDESIGFPDREFSTSDDLDNLYGGFTHIAGTLVGGDIGPKNNTVSVNCLQNERRCELAFSGQTGSSIIDSISITDFEVTKWGASLISAKDEELCSTETINISPTTKHVEFVIVPTNQDKPYCEHADTNIRKMTLERSPFWQRIDPKNQSGS